MDGGAIYAWTQNDNAIIRYNYIHDYVGAGYNRGIYLDDGVSNIKLYGNIITNTPSYYSIDSRYVKDHAYGYSNNSNNLIAYNVVDNYICFMGYKGEERQCRKGPNFILLKDNPSITSKYEALASKNDDVEIVSFNKDVTKSIKKKELRIIKKNPWFKVLK